MQSFALNPKKQTGVTNTVLSSALRRFHNISSDYRYIKTVEQGFGSTKWGHQEDQTDVKVFIKDAQGNGN